MQIKRIAHTFLLLSVFSLAICSNAAPNSRRSHDDRDFRAEGKQDRIKHQKRQYSLNGHKVRDKKSRKHKSRKHAEGRGNGARNNEENHRGDRGNSDRNHSGRGNQDHRRDDGDSYRGSSRGNNHRDRNDGRHASNRHQRSHRHHKANRRHGRSSRYDRKHGRHGSYYPAYGFRFYDRSDNDWYYIRRHDYGDDWHKAADFRTKEHRIYERVIPIRGHVTALEIEGMRRGTYVHEAYIEFDNNRLRRVPELEGYYGVWSRRQYRLEQQRYVRQIYLHVSPTEHKRGYARVYYQRY